MTDTKIREATAREPSQLGRLDRPGPPGKAKSPGKAKKRGPGAGTALPGETFWIGSWALWFLGRAARADYQCQVTSLNDDLTGYLRATKHLSVSDRLEISERPPSLYKRPGAFWFIHELIRFRPAQDDQPSSGRGSREGNGGQQQPGRRRPSSLELMNAYQAWEAVFDRFIWAIACLVVFPLWLVCAIAASALAGSSPPLAAKLVYLCILALFAGKVFAAYLRIKDRESVVNLKPDNLRRLCAMLLGLSRQQPIPASQEPTSSGEGPTSSRAGPVPAGGQPIRSGEQPVPASWLLRLPSWLLRLPGWLLTLLSWLRTLLGWLPRPLSWLVDLSAVAVSGWLLYGAWARLGPLAASGALLLAMLGTLVVAVAAICLVLIAESNTGSVRMTAVAVYLAAAVALVLAAKLGRPGWPPWLVHGAWSAVWASLILVGVLAAVSLICSLARVGLWHRKNRRHVVEELIQTLTWLGQRLEDREIADMSEVGLFDDLEYTAGLIQNYLPRMLRTQDPAGDSGVAEQCRGIAAAFRELKLEVALNQSMSRGEIAGRIVPVIGPIFHGDWDKIPRASQEGLASSRLKHTARGLSQIVIAVVPLAALLALHDLQIASSTVFAQALPIVVTWLIVSVLAWIDPRSESSISSVANIMGTWRR